MVKTGKRKWNNAQTVIDGQAFDSAGEARRWLELRALEQAGDITDLSRQVRLRLQPAFRCTLDGTNERIRAIEYVADFAYTEVGTGTWVIEDYKGVRTDEFELKRKLLLFLLQQRADESDRQRIAFRITGTDARRRRSGSGSRSGGKPWRKRK